MSKSTYRRMTTVPKHVAFLAPANTPTDKLPPENKWSNLTFAVPAIGTIVHVWINRIGAARVESYFIEHGFLGLLVKPLAPPEWFVKQNGRYSECHVFGTEVEPLTDDPATRVTARVVRHRGYDRKDDRFTVQVRSANGMLLLDGNEKRRDPELAVKLAVKFCQKNKLNLFSVEVLS